ncbi:TRAP transporter large permease subunit [Rhodospirillaceae bacterium SYSU D60014]|uniref:TRAP transporter large permease n=1 Tax=Virgifigura deserti TaxID=2268457 RepID=UPI000E669210
MYLVDLLPVFMFLMLAAFIFTGYPVAFVLGGTAVAFGFGGWAFDVFSLIEFQNIAARIYGSVAANLILTAVPMFIFMGTMLEKSGVAEDLLQSLQVALRRIPGGLALSVTLMGVVMAATTGIVGASVIMMTLLAIPVLLSRGYNIELAAGTIAASGTLGILIPPSIMLVIMADLLAISVGTLFVAALIPGLILAAFYLGYIGILAAAKPHLAPPMRKEEGPQHLSAVLFMLSKSLLPPAFLMIVVLGSIFLGWATPTEAAGVGALGATLLALMNGRLSLAVLKEVVQRTAMTNVMLFMIFLGATAFAYVFRSLGGDYLVVDFFEGMNLGPWPALLLMLIVIFLLGFLFDWIEILLIVLPIFVPILELLDFGDHVGATDLVPWFAILVAVNLQTSYLTPPFGYALFYMRGAAPPEVTMPRIYRGIIPFVVLQMLAVVAVAAFPQIALWLPHYLLR